MKLLLAIVLSSFALTVAADTVKPLSTADADYAQAQQQCRDPKLTKADAKACMKAAQAAHKKAVAAAKVTTTTTTTVAPAASAPAK
jgi:hypothetical protein